MPSMHSASQSSGHRPHHQQLPRARACTRLFLQLAGHARRRRGQAHVGGGRRRLQSQRHDHAMLVDQRDAIAPRPAVTSGWVALYVPSKSDSFFRLKTSPTASTEAIASLLLLTPSPCTSNACWVPLFKSSVPLPQVTPGPLEGTATVPANTTPPEGFRDSPACPHTTKRRVAVKLTVIRIL